MKTLRWTKYAALHNYPCYAYSPLSLLPPICVRPLFRYFTSVVKLFIPIIPFQNFFQTNCTIYSGACPSSNSCSFLDHSGLAVQVQASCRAALPVFWERWTVRQVAAAALAHQPRLISHPLRPMIQQSMIILTYWNVCKCAFSRGDFGSSTIVERKLRENRCFSRVDQFNSYFPHAAYIQLFLII